MAKVLAISSQTVFGPVGLSALVPALQSQGHEVLALPTITLSHHPGHGQPAGSRTSAQLMRDMLQGLDRIGALHDVDAVITGYFADAEQVRAAAWAIETMIPSARHILVDPVIGDDGALYVPETVAAEIRLALLPLATIITPNLFELQWLAGQQDEVDAVDRLARAETLVTSVPDGTLLATHLYASGVRHLHVGKRQDGVPHGTGDHLAGLYLAHRLKDNPATAFKKAMAGLEHVIAASVGSISLKVAAITTVR